MGYVVFHRNELVTDLRSEEPCLLPRDQVRFLGPPPVRQHFLGFWLGKPCYARELDSESPLDMPQFQTGNLYHILGRVSDELFALAGRAQQVLAWERDNRFCGTCGESMETHDRERAMRCQPAEVVARFRLRARAASLRRHRARDGGHQ